MFVDGKSALEYIKVYWNENVKGKMDKQTAKLLKEPLINAVYNELENVIYIPAPYEAYKDWFEDSFLGSFKEFFNEKFDIDDVVIETVDLEELIS